MSGVEKLPAEVQAAVTAKLGEYNKLRATLDAIRQEILNTELLLNEVETALSDLAKLPDDTTVYKAVGGVLVRKSKKEVVEELEGRKLVLQERLKKLKENEKQIVSAIAKLQDEINAMLRRSLGGREGGVGGGVAG